MILQLLVLRIQYSILKRGFRMDSVFILLSKCAIKPPTNMGVESPKGKYIPTAMGMRCNLKDIRLLSRIVSPSKIITPMNAPIPTISHGRCPVPKKPSARLATNLPEVQLILSYTQVYFHAIIALLLPPMMLRQHQYFAFAA